MKLYFRANNQSTIQSAATSSANLSSISLDQKSSVNDEIPKKGKKTKEVSSSREKKFHRIFEQQISKEEKLLNCKKHC